MGKIVRLNEDGLRKFVMNMLSEISQNKKKQLTDTAIGTIKGDIDWVKTIAIFTAENPSADDIDYENMAGAEKRANSQRNKKLNRDLSLTLRQGGFMFKPVKGKYGNLEHLVMVFNIPLGIALRYGKYYGQSSIIFCKHNEDGSMDYQYWESINDWSFPTKEEHEILDANGQDDFFTEISRKFKFQIPFRFEAVNKEIGTIITSHMSVDEGIKRLNGSFKGGQEGYMHRKFLLGNNDNLL